MESYLKALHNGDENVYFIDGEALLGDVDAEEYLVDGTHPTDGGFQNMAKRIYPILKYILGEKI